MAAVSAIQKPIFVETAFRDKSGRVYRTGAVHNIDLVPAHARREAIPGFINRRGRFVDRPTAGYTSGRFERRFQPHLREHIWTGESSTMRYHGMMPRKSSVDGGDVQVSAHERDGHPVQAYTRSKPS